MEIPEILMRIVEAIESKEGENTVVMKMENTPIPTDYFIITTANSKTHMKALRDSVVEELKKSSHEIIYYDKKTNLSWVLVDAGEFVIHIFTKKAREFYDLEGLWHSAERIKIGSPTDEVLR